MTSSNRPTVDPATWRQARAEFMEREKAFTRERDALSAARRELPWLKIDDIYNHGTSPAHGEEMPGISTFVRRGDDAYPAS